ncbi:hypothetical protein KC364_g16594, partial [Hortaea werneckii]
MPPTHPSPPRPTITIRPRRHPEDLLPLTQLLQTVYDRDAYPVQGTADAEAFLTQPSTLRAWVAETSSSSSSSSSEIGEENGERRGQIVGHIAVSRPREGDVAVKLWRELHQRRGAIDGGQEEEGEPIALLERLFIHPSFRNHGLASSLLGTAENWARSRTTTLIPTTFPEEKSSPQDDLQDSPGQQQQQQNPKKQNKPKKATRLLLFALAKDENAMRLYRRRGWEEFGRTGFGWEEWGSSGYGGREGGGEGVEGEGGGGERKEMEAICF